MLAAVKKILCQLLIGWLALVSSGVHALTLNDAAHEAAHSQCQGEQVSLNQTAELDTVTKSEDTHSDTCIHVNCGHASALLAPLGASTSAEALTAVPVFHRRWFSNALSSNIERPKWVLTTPAVVSRLG